MYVHRLIDSYVAFLHCSYITLQINCNFLRFDLIYIVLFLLWYCNIFRLNANVKERPVPLFYLLYFVVLPDDGRNCRPKPVVYVINVRAFMVLY